MSFIEKLLGEEFGKELKKENKLQEKVENKSQKKVEDKKEEKKTTRSVFSWKITEEELREQIDNYKTLKITQSYRGISVLIL